MKRPTLRDRAEYAVARTIEAALDRLTPAMAERLGGTLGELLYSPLKIRRGVVESNLALAFPEADPAWRDRVARAAYRHLGREAIAMARLSVLGREGVLRTVEIPDEDWAEFERIRAGGRGVILATGHYGNWELAAAAVAARGVPVVAIVKRLRNPLVDRRIAEARRALGVETVAMSQASRRIPRVLARGGSVGIVADQDARRSGIFVPFFGVPASTHRGTALFALRYDAAVFAAVCRRLPDGRYRLSGPSLDIRRTASLDDDVTRLTALIAFHLEREIREDPTQYFWFHKRWKTRPAEEPAPIHAGTTSHGGQGARPPEDPQVSGRRDGL